MIGCGSGTTLDIGKSRRRVHYRRIPQARARRDSRCGTVRDRVTCSNSARSSSDNIGLTDISFVRAEGVGRSQDAESVAMQLAEAQIAAAVQKAA